MVEAVVVKAYTRAPRDKEEMRLNNRKAALTRWRKNKKKVN